MIPTTEMLNFQFKEAHCGKSVRIWSYCVSAFSRIWTEYRKIQTISPYSVLMRENADQNNSEYGHISRSGVKSLMKITLILLLNN